MGGVGPGVMASVGSGVIGGNSPSSKTRTGVGVSVAMEVAVIILGGVGVDVP